MSRPQLIATNVPSETSFTISATSTARAALAAARCVVTPLPESFLMLRCTQSLQYCPFFASQTPMSVARVTVKRIKTSVRS